MRSPPTEYDGNSFTWVTSHRIKKPSHRLGVTGWMASSVLLYMFCSYLQQHEASVFPQATQKTEGSFLHIEPSWATHCSQIKSMSHTITPRKIRHVVTSPYNDLDSIHARANVPRRRWKPGYGQGRRNKPHRIYWLGTPAHACTHPVLQNSSNQFKSVRSCHHSHLAN